MDNSQKTPLGRSINQTAVNRVQDAVLRNGKALPCKVVAVAAPFVTVTFDVNSMFSLPSVTVPYGASKYTRLPIQVGDTGLVFPADVFIGSVTGQSGPSGLAQPANLAALVYFPISTKAWPMNADFNQPNYLVLYGPDGTILTDAAQDTALTLNELGITILVGSGGRVSIDVDLNVTGGTVNVTGGDVIADGRSLKHHVHSGVTTGSDDTGPPV